MFVPPVTVGVKSSDSRNYSYTWTRNGTAFPPNIAGIDSSILIGSNLCRYCNNKRRDKLF